MKNSSIMKNIAKIDWTSAGFSHMKNPNTFSASLSRQEKPKVSNGLNQITTVKLRWLLPESKKKI